MEIVLVQNMLTIPTHGGANSSNSVLLESLAQQGHRVVIVAPASAPGSAIPSEASFYEALRDRGLSAHPLSDTVCVVEKNGVSIHAVLPGERGSVLACMHDALQNVVTSATDWVLVSSDDGGEVLLESAHTVCPGRVICISHTSTALPFGPMAATQNSDHARLMRKSAAVFVGSDYMQTYARQWGDVEAVNAAIEPFIPNDYPNYASFEEGYVTLINPCDLKGLSIFLALADRFPEVPFAAVPTWGTTSEDRAALAHRSNVTVLDPVDDIDAIYAQTRILLMPSLWIETFGRCATEAMQRGLPVLASDHGGLPEAMGGADYLLPVRPIPSVSQQVSERGRVQPERVPKQDVTPWVDALDRLLTDREHYSHISQQARAAAARVVHHNRPQVFIDALLSVSPGQGTHAQNRTSSDTSATEAASPSGSSTSSLSPEKRRLLAHRALRNQD